MKLQRRFELFGDFYTRGPFNEVGKQKNGTLTKQERRGERRLTYISTPQWSHPIVSASYLVWETEVCFMLCQNKNKLKRKYPILRIPSFQKHGWKWIVKIAL